MTIPDADALLASAPPELAPARTAVRFGRQAVLDLPGRPFQQHAAHAGRSASTLTQQLAKLLVTGGARSPLRKLRELLYAAGNDPALGKPHILQFYLTLVL